MTKKISNFKISEFLLRAFCEINDLVFVDLPIFFTEDNTSSYQEDGLHIPNYDKLNKTYFSIIGAYLTYLQSSKIAEHINEDSKIYFLNFSTSIIRDLSYSQFSTTSDVKNNVLTKLNRNPFMWILFRDVICPSFNISISNIPVIYGRLGNVDGAEFIESGVKNLSEPLVFCNIEIDNPYCRDAFLLFEILKSHELNPKSVINEIFNKEEILSKLIGLSKIAYIHTDGINDFLITLCMLSEYQNYDNILIKEAKDSFNKVVQSQSYTPSNTWWNFGLIEKMLSPARNPDWTGYFNNQEIIHSLWEKCEKERKSRGLKELPYEILLIVQSNEFKQRADVTIQSLLSDNRVW